MSSWKRRAAPFLLTGLVVGGLISGQLTAANAAPELPAKSSTQVLALALSAQPRAHTGTVVQVSNLGLPDLSGLTDSTGSITTGNAANPLGTVVELLSSDQKYRVAFAPGKARVQRYLPTGEQDLVFNGTSLWLWDSAQTGSATHYVGPTLPRTSQREAKVKRDWEALAQDLLPSVTPEQIATKLLAAVHHDGTSSLTVGKSAYVAGRAAYVLVLTPKQRAALVGSVQVALDAQTGQVLRLQVRTRASDKVAYELGYTSITYGAPPPSTFTFTPPPGAKVKVVNWGAQLRAELAALRAQPSAALQGIGGLLAGAAQAIRQETEAKQTISAGGVQVSGSGLATVVRIPAAAVPAEFKPAQFKRLSTPAPGGARVIETTLLTVLFARNGDVLVGSVPLSVLEKQDA